MPQTPELSVVLPPELLDAARRAAGRPEAKPGEIVRLALAHLAGVDVDAHPVRRGRPRRQPAAVGELDVSRDKGSAA